MNSGMRTGLVVIGSAAITMMTVLLVVLAMSSSTRASNPTAQPERAVIRAVQKNVDLNVQRRQDAARLSQPGDSLNRPAR